jgi:hypothetical protein
MKRFGVYFVLGLAFGVLDWYYLDGLAHFPWGSFGNSIFVVPVIILLNYGIWLVPILPIAWRETRAGRGIRFPMLAGILTWSGAIFSYYAYYAILLSLGVLPNLENLNVFGDRYPGFWSDWLVTFQKVILNQFIEWIVIAMIGGGVIGACMYVLSRRLTTHDPLPMPSGRPH